MPEVTEFEIELPASEFAKAVTFKVKITGYRAWLWRWQVAIRLLRLAAWVAGAGITIDARQETETDSPEAATGESWQTSAE